MKLLGRRLDLGVEEVVEQGRGSLPRIGAPTSSVGSLKGVGRSHHELLSFTCVFASKLYAVLSPLQCYWGIGLYWAGIALASEGVSRERSQYPWPLETC